MKVSEYYQAHVVPAYGWFFVGVLRSYEHVCFDRTFDVHNSIFEFFVPADQEHLFLQIMSYFQREGIITNLTKLPHRLLDPHQSV